jgi:hypothetical protein
VIAVAAGIVVPYDKSGIDVDRWAFAVGGTIGLGDAFKALRDGSAGTDADVDVDE